MAIEDVFKAAGADEAAVLKRFSGSKALIVRFFKKFPNDPSFASLQSALAEQRYADVEQAAHTLKGVSANLGFQPLSDLCADLMEKVRKGETTNLDALFQSIAEQYHAIVDAIKTLG